MSTNPFCGPPTAAELLPVQGDESSPVPSDGRALRRMQDSGGYATAISVQQPRDLVAVERRVLREAELLGESAYYRWPVKNKKSGAVTMVQGGTIKLAEMLARNWYNCVVENGEVEDVGDAWIMSAAFVDLESGYTRIRRYRQSKGAAVGGDYDDERKADIRFQNGQSRAARNVALSALPAWLVEGAIARAKGGVRTRLEVFIKTEGIDKARERLLEDLRRNGVEPTRAIEKMGRKEVAGLTVDDLVLLRGDLTALIDGAEQPDSLFPQSHPPTESTADLREKLTKPAPDAPTTNEVISQVQQDAPSEPKPETVAADSPIAASALRTEVLAAIVDLAEEDVVGALDRAGITCMGDVAKIDDVPRLRSILAAIKKDT